VGSVVDKVAMGQVFSKYFGFPCQLFHHCSTLIIINHSGQTVADKPNGLSLTSPKERKEEKPQQFEKL
jgi:hypothetical protein